jgi:hypothetical protein
MDDSSAVPALSDKPWLFRPGHSEYRAKKQRIAARLEQLLADHDPTPSQKQILAVVAHHLDDAERARSLVQRVRAGNAARRLLKDIPRKPPAASMTARELLDRL